jgi:hypothetical protein
MKKNMKEIMNVRRAYIVPDIEQVPVDTETSLLAAVSANGDDPVTEDPPLDTTTDDPFATP